AAARPRHRRAPRGGCVDHALHRCRQYECANDHDRREGVRYDPGRRSRTADVATCPLTPPLPLRGTGRGEAPGEGATARNYLTVATLSAFVVPECPNGTPATTTISSLCVANPSVCATRIARVTASPIECTSGDTTACTPHTTAIRRAVAT